MITNLIRDFIRWLTTLFLHLLAGWAGPRRPVVEEILEVRRARWDLEVFTELRGFDEQDLPQIQALIDEFHRNVQRRLKQIVRRTTDSGIHLADTPVGVGLFNGNGILKHKLKTPIAFYISSLSTEHQYWVDGDFTYGMDYDYDLLGYECALDGQFSLHHRVAYNGCFFNHSCNPNCFCNMEEDPESGVWYMVFYPLRDVRPGEELTIDYNDGVKTGRNGRELAVGYWRNATHFAGVPRQFLVQCQCVYPERCPKNRAFDSRAKRRKPPAGMH